MRDEGETLSRAGELLIHRGTQRTWSNCSGRLCRMAFELVEAGPLKNR